MTSVPQLEQPVRRGSPLMGVLGALIGSVTSAALWFLLLPAVPDDWNQLAFLSGFFVGPMSCLGYRLFRGLRSSRFALNTVRICAVLSPFLGTLCGLTVRELFRGLPLSRFVALLRASLEILTDRERAGALVFFALFFLLSTRLGHGLLLAYTDPEWYNSPQRMAQTGGGGATFNVPPCWPLPLVKNIPEEFEVDKGKLTVKGDAITVKRWGKAPKSFSVGELAGVILGVPDGYNILYDKENRALARFTWSRKNALLFGQYLIQREVPFLDLNGTPVAVQNPNPQCAPRQFTVREGKLCLMLGWIGMVMFSTAALACLLFLEGTEKLLCAALVLPPLALFSCVLLCYYNRRLEVDGELVIYTTFLKRTSRFWLSDVADITWGPNGFKLKDRQGRTLARFEDTMESAGFLFARWNEYKQERTE